MNDQDKIADLTAENANLKLALAERKAKIAELMGEAARAEIAGAAVQGAGEVPRLIELLNAIKPNFGDVGSRDVDVRAQRERIEEAIAILSAAPAAPAAPSEQAEKLMADMDTMRDEYASLSNALAFWLPTVPEQAGAIQDRIVHDVFFLGEHGEPKSAQDLGWITLNGGQSAPTAPLPAQPEPQGELLAYFLRSAYPVDTSIDARGYRWSEAYLDQARAAALAGAAPLPAAPAPTEQAGELLTRDAIDGINWLNDSMPLSDDVPQPIAGTIVLLETFARLGMTAKSDGKPTPNSFLCLRFAAELRALAANQAPRESKAEQAALPSDFLMPEDAWNEYATRSGLLNERGVAPHPATAQAAYFAYQAAWNCLHKAFSAYIAARPAPTVPKLDYDLLRLALEQTQERLRQAEEAIAKRDATALRVAQCAGEFARDAARFATAIALEDNAETLYSVVMSHAPDTAAIRRAFDAAIAQEKAQ